MIDKQEAAIFKSKQDFNRNKEKISEYIKYAENWQVISVMCSYTAMACDVLIVIMIVFFLKYRKTMQAMLAAFLQTNTKNSGIQSVQTDQMGRTYPPLFTINLLKEEEILDDLKEISAMEYVVQGYYDYCVYSSCNYYHVFLLHKMQTHPHYIQILLSILADFTYSTYVTSYRFVCQSE